MHIYVEGKLDNNHYQGRIYIISFYCELKPHAKFLNLRTNPSNGKVTKAERKRKREKRKIAAGQIFAL